MVSYIGIYLKRRYGMALILASGSPRRRELMHLITDDFTVKTTDADETLPADIDPAKAAEFLAVQKAKAAAELYPEDTVIGCDTTVIHDGRILGKPADRADAEKMLKALSGCTHQVITGAAIISGGRVFSFSETTQVEFYPLTDSEIQSYLDTDEPYDKAGSYGIQGKGSLFIKGIKGDYFNVVGLPVALLYRKLKEIKEI